MPRDVRFWRNVTIIGVAHIALLLGLIRLTGETRKPSANDIVWMTADGGESAAAQNSVLTNMASNELDQMPSAVAKSTPESEEQPTTAPVKSEIQLPTPRRTPAPTATPTPKPTETPTPKSSPKSAPRSKPTPKNAVVAKASPKPTAKGKEKDDSNQAEKAEGKKKEIAKAALAKKQPSNNSENPAKNAKAVRGPDKSGTMGGDGPSEFGWYGNMLHDRFYSEWAQPMTVVASGARLSTLVKLRIEKDGRVSAFTVIRPSGNVVVDESVAAVAKRVTQVDPLPAGLGGEHYDVKINFELNPEQ